MTIYHFMFNAKPLPSKPESSIYSGAHIYCWVNSETHYDAVEKATEYCRKEGWEVVAIEEDFIVRREQYKDTPQSLECFDEAVEYGVSGIFSYRSIDT